MVKGERGLRAVIRESLHAMDEMGLKGYDRWKTEPGPYGSGDEGGNEEGVLAATKDLLSREDFVSAALGGGASTLPELVSDVLQLIGDEWIDVVGSAGLDTDPRGDDMRDLATNVASSLKGRL